MRTAVGYLPGRRPLAGVLEAAKVARGLLVPHLVPRAPRYDAGQRPHVTGRFSVARDRLMVSEDEGGGD
ncbi:hypothetical protein ON010_g8941 [Phytophthora cinnamomi]|nr:hypothetical protein ON010_g8941 [Phytophthora cinnamomi]